jgi:RNA polymerase sigma-70 factor, ECF subfamily
MNASPTFDDDVALMRRTADGDRDALSTLYDRHAPTLYAVLMQKLADPAEAQDTLHDVFLKLGTKSVQYNVALGKPIAWMLTMAKNAATDKLRRKVTHRRYVESAVHEVEQQAPAHPGMYTDELELLRNCLATLSSVQRNTLNFAYFSGMTQQEISDKMGQPLGSVKGWIRRGLLKLKDCVETKL